MVISAPTNSFAVILIQALLRAYADHLSLSLIRNSETDSIIIRNVKPVVFKGRWKRETMGVGKEANVR
jgi:hypothetical protein